MAATPTCDYGLLEARVYAHFLQAILSSHGHQLHQELSSCLLKYHGIDSQLKKLPMIVEFAVAAPDWYLKQQKQESQIGQRVEAILYELVKESSLSVVYLVKEKYSYVSSSLFRKIPH